MVNLLLFIVCSSTFSSKDSTNFSVLIELLRPATSNEISLKIDVRNLTGKPMMVLKNRREDYKRKKIRALGNYVIEIQKKQSGLYELFEPSADINPIYQKEDFVELQNGNSIIDTLTVKGFIFSRATDPKSGFPAGKYRIRVYFNADMWSTNEGNGSNWLEFSIE